MAVVWPVPFRWKISFTSTGVATKRTTADWMTVARSSGIPVRGLHVAPADAESGEEQRRPHDAHRVGFARAGPR